MNSIQNYGMTNFNAGNRLAFKANLAEPLKDTIVKELDAAGKERLDKAVEKLANIKPYDCTIQDIIISSCKKGMSIVRICCNGSSKTFEIFSNNKSKLDIIEGLVHENESETSRLSEFVCRLFGI